MPSSLAIITEAESPSEFNPSELSLSLSDSEDGVLAQESLSESLVPEASSPAFLQTSRKLDFFFVDFVLTPVVLSSGSCSVSLC